MQKTILGCLTFLLMLGWTACKPEEPVIELTEFHFTANFNGDSLTVIDQGSLPAQLGFYSDKDSIGIDGVDCEVSYLAQFRDIGNLNKQGVFFTFNRYYNGLCSSEPEDFRTLFLPEIQPVAATENVRGWIFLYRDADGNSWSSLKGDQSASQLEILTTEALPDDVGFGFKQQKITGTLHCTLYNDAGDSLPLTNGKFSIYIVSYDW